MLVVGKDSFAFVMRQHLIDIGDDVEIFQVYAARNCLPVALPGTAADVFLEYELGVLVPEVLRLGPALLYAAVNNTVISDTRSAVRSVIQIDDMALEIINRADSRFMPAMRGVSEAIGQRGNRCTFRDLAPDRLWRTCRIFVHDPDFTLQVPAGMPVLEHLRPDQEIIAIGQKQHPQKRMMIAEPLGQVAHFTGSEIDFADIPIVLFDESNTLTVRRPVRSLAVFKELLVVRRRVIENVRTFERLVVGFVDRHESGLQVSDYIGYLVRLQSARAPVALTTLPHFSISLRM